MPTVLVIGTGLIGASIGLAVHGSQGYRVLLHDREPAARDAAAARGAGEPWDGVETVDLLVAAAPPQALAGILLEAQKLNLARIYSHVGSVQSQVQAEVESLGCDLQSLVGSHPLAGRETSGPGAATSDLFSGRPWALCPSPASSTAALEQMRALALACGAVPVVVEPAEHDASVALLSHLPQLVASALAALVGRESAQTATEVARPRLRTELSGPGLADTTRLAASDPTLWTEILTANAGPVAAAVRGLASMLDELAADLEVLQGVPASDARAAAARRGIFQLLSDGNAGRTLVPVKRGVRDDGFARVAVEVDDRPGRLAALLTDAGSAGVNVEDVRVEHVPGRPRGVIELLVSTTAAGELEAALRRSGWSLRGTHTAIST